MDSKFVKDILSGNKALLLNSKVIFVTNVPHWKELTSENIWNEVKSDRNVTKYFKDYIKGLPSR